MTLLSPVCRQLYHETALLPYSLNAWSFETRHVMERYLIKEKRLPRPHRRAIKLLYSQHVLPSLVEKYFGGLKTIMLENGITMTKEVDDADPENPRRQSSAWEVSRHVWKGGYTGRHCRPRQAVSCLEKAVSSRAVPSPCPRP